MLRLVRRRERLVTTLYLLGFGAILGALVIGPVRNQVFAGVEHVIHLWDARWIQRLEHGERLLQNGEYEAAATYLSALDRDFPARHVKHAKDKERERLLMGLGEAYLALDRKRFTLTTFRRLVAFDPRNFANHFALARAAQHFDEPEEAHTHFERVLQIHPTHLPSLSQDIAYHMDRGAFDRVVAVYENYLDAFVVRPVRVRLGSRDTVIDVPMDGRWHECETILPGEVVRGDSLILETGGASVDVGEVTLEAPIRVGRPPVPGRARLVPRGRWRFRSLASIDEGLYRARSSESAVIIPIAGPPGKVNRVRFELRFPKPVDAKVWGQVEQAYANLLEMDRLAAARQRSVVYDPLVVQALAVR